MERQLAERVEEMIAALKNWQEFLAANGHEESSQLLEICKTDLQMKLHDISDSELAQFCEAIRETHCGVAASKFDEARLGPYLNGAEMLPLSKNVAIMKQARVANRRKTRRRI